MKQVIVGELIPDCPGSTRGMAHEREREREHGTSEK